MLYVTYRGLLYWTLYEAGYWPVYIADGMAAMKAGV